MQPNPIQAAANGSRKRLEYHLTGEFFAAPCQNGLRKRILMNADPDHRIDL
jgi:hypothetical protein